ncbi:MAG: hypothetical protein LBL04_10920 [Bacteroidales bacterium]|nr:hypothetical protein [Bacteroidales bacterium]
MLQKGFLKPLEKGNTRTVKTSRTFLFAGVIIMLSALVYMMMNMQRADRILSVWQPVMIAGICSVFISLWMNFFLQNKNRRR